MKPNITIKQVVRYSMVLVAFIVSVGQTALGAAPSSDATANVNVAKAPIQLSDSWTQTNWTETNSYFNLSSSKNTVFARIWNSLSGGRTFLTTNDGTDWTSIGTADNSMDILSIITLDSRILAGTWNGLYESTNNGTTWSAITPTGLPADVPIFSIEKANATLYAGTTGTMYASTDDGNTWTAIGSGIAAEARITSIVVSGDTLFAATASNGIYKMASNGTSWASINKNLTDTHITQFVALDHQLVAITLTGVYLSNNGGNSWTADTSGLKKVNCLVAISDRVIAGTDGNGTYLLDDNGVTWSSFNMGMPADTRIWSLALNRDGIFAGTSNGILFLSAPNVLDGVKEISVPSTFRLEQNYPNPFRESTTLSFYIPSTSFVSLKVFDLQGKEVATIISEELPTGYHTQQWDAGSLSSGIYIYRLQVGSYSESKKLIIMR